MYVEENKMRITMLHNILSVHHLENETTTPVFKGSVTISGLF